MTAYPEPTVARVCGVNKGLLAETRKRRLAKGEDWTLEGAVVCYTPAGLTKICAALRLDEALAGTCAAVGAEAREVALAPQGEAIVQEVETVVTVEIGTADPGASADAVDVTDAYTATAVESTPWITKAGEVAEVIGTAVEQAARPAPLAYLQVTRLSPNPQILFAAWHEGAGREVTVKVRANSAFYRGCWIRGEKLSDTHFHHVGRAPRWAGDRVGFPPPPQVSPEEKSA